jgi:DNA (cytosine-5)-methyltransferase 1
VEHLDLFSGIGGFALAARWMNWKTVQFVEIDSFCQKVLTKNFPNIPIHGDIKTFDGTKYRGAIDILTGGFPCQPYSTAGKRKGKEDDRHLWPEMLRIIREVQPRWIVGENVRGLTNWSGGLVFDEVQAHLETEGYQVLPFLLPAAGVGAWHRRDRIWFIAHSDNFLHQGKLDAGSDTRKAGTSERTNQAERKASFRKRLRAESSASRTPFTNTNSQGLQERQINSRMERETITKYEREIFTLRDERITTPLICGKDHGVPNRMDRIKALGNAVVPQLVYEIFKAIDLYDKEETP